MTVTTNEAAAIAGIDPARSWRNAAEWTPELEAGA